MIDDVKFVDGNWKLVVGCWREKTARHVRFHYGGNEGIVFAFTLSPPLNTDIQRIRDPQKASRITASPLTSDHEDRKAKGVTDPAVHSRVRVFDISIT